MSNFALKFVGEKNVSEAVEKVKQLKEDKTSSSLFYLEEYERELDVINQTVEELIKIIERIGSLGLDIHISVDPTQIGLQLNKEICSTNAFKITRAIKNISKKMKLIQKIF